MNNMKKFLFTIIVLLFSFSAAAEEPSPLNVFHAPSNPVDLYVTRDGKFLFFASTTEGVVQSNVEIGERVRVFEIGVGSRPMNILLSEDETLLLTGDRWSEYAELWDLTTNTVLQHYGPHLMASASPGGSASAIYALHIASDRSYCVTWGAYSNINLTAAHFWDFETGEKLFSIMPDNELHGSFPVITSDERYLIMGHEVWDIEAREKIHFLDPSAHGIGEPFGDRDFLTDLVLIDEKHTVLFSDIGGVTEWNYETGEFIRSIDVDFSRNIEVSPDRRWLMGLTYSTNGYVYILYDFQTGNKIAEIKYPNLDSSSLFKFHPNSHQVFSIILDEIHLWDINDYLQQSSNSCAENYR